MKLYKYISLLALSVASFNVFATSAPKSIAYVAPKTAVKQQAITISGKVLRYKASAGVMPIRDAAGRIQAYLSYIAYTKLGVSNYRHRPITFLYNGGPGSASLDINFLGTGPKVAALTAKGAAKGFPGKLVSNPATWLQFTDEVYVDMLGTGWGRALHPKIQKKYWNINGDAKSFGEFIRNYLKQQHRFISPLYIAGESYGGMRSPALVKYLNSNYSMPVNGIVLISPYTNSVSADTYRGSNLAYVLSLPTMTAVALYHHKLDKAMQTQPLQTIKAAEKWALHKYWALLVQGDGLTKQQQDQLVLNLHNYTGLAKATIIKHYYRIDPDLFTRELLRTQKKRLSILDGRFAQDNLSTKSVDNENLNDAMINNADWASHAGVLHFLYTELGFKINIPYLLNPDKPYDKWRWFTDANDLALPQVLDDWHDIMVVNPRLKVFVASGYYDLDMPFLVQKYDINQLRLPKNIAANITQHMFWAGHMLYINKASRMRLFKEVKGFYLS